MIEFIFFPVVNEGCRVIEEGERRWVWVGGLLGGWVRACEPPPHAHTPPPTPLCLPGIVEKPADLDVATVMAMGFPPYRYVCVRGGGREGRCEGWRGPLPPSHAPAR